MTDSGTDTNAGDAADTSADTGTRPVFCLAPEVRFSRATLSSTLAIPRTVRVTLANDFCEAATITIVSSDESVATIDATAVIPAGQSVAELTITPRALGTTTFTATFADLVGTEDEVITTADLVFEVQDDTLPSCSVSASGNLAPGGEVADGPAIAIPAGAARDDRFHVDPFDVTITCAPDQVPDGYRALGPAITFAPEATQLRREIAFTVPAKLALLQEGAHRGHVFLAYRGPGLDARVVPVASPDFESRPGFVTFFAPRLGTYQAVVLADAPRERQRDFSYDAITGVSMGGGGSALIGLRDPTSFDFVAPLGGPVDWISMVDQVRRFHLGGFCTEAERVADPAGCAAGASTSRVPTSLQLFEEEQDFEHWNYREGFAGHGGTFDRREYIRIFHDMSLMFGNINTTRAVDPLMPNVTPPGVPDSERARDRATRCAEPLRIPPDDGSMTVGYFDDEYNPDGAYPLITFCDGGELLVDGERDRGVWDPAGSHTAPVHVAWAVDINDNGVRDLGEPVVRAVREPYEDCGLDQLCNADEPGFDADTNPDPAGDDYDYQYNPSGTEGNTLRDGEPCGAGETYEDAGLDGVMGTAQLSDGGYDFGEADGCHTRSRGFTQMLENNPRSFVLNAEADALGELDLFSDGGIRDLFHFAMVHNHFAGAFTARGVPMNMYNSHAALRFDGSSLDSDFKFARTDWSEVGKYIHIRYGDVDANEGQIAQGDGGHVGTPSQIVNRLLSVIAWMSARWPDGDRRRVNDRICVAPSEACPQLNQFTIDFTASTGRVGPVTIVLPPGYYDEEFADVSFPVVYFLHGYGQDPTDLLPVGLILWNFMTARTIPEAERLQKMIFVFPDGRCRDGECVKGTFFADAPPSTPNGAQMETFLQDLRAHVRDNYRVRAPETRTVVE